MSILIQHARFVSSDAIRTADIFIEHGKIVLIGNRLAISKPIDQTIDASRFIVLPGGIDPHVHLHLPTPAGFSVDDFRSGTEAALLGGTTTIIDFVTTHKGQSIVDALDERIVEANHALCDYSFHISPVEWRNTTEKEIGVCIERGFPSIKVYLAYQESIGLADDDLYKVMQAVAKAGGIVTAHCEMGNEIDKRRNAFFNEGKVAPEYHALSRPPKTESDAVKKAIELAAKAACTLYIVHVSAAESLLHIRHAQEQGQRVFAETCPHYLLLNDRLYQGTFEQTAPFVMSPPLRKKKDNEALWEAIQAKVIQTVGTDHCPFSLTQKSAGRDDFRKIPNGVPGISQRLNLLYAYGVCLRNNFNINQLVDVFATNPAKIFGLYPQKAAIEIGSDADLVLYNTKPLELTTTKPLTNKNDIYKTLKYNGMPEVVILRGEVVVDKGILVNKPKGKLIRRRIG